MFAGFDYGTSNCSIGLVRDGVLSDLAARRVYAEMATGSDSAQGIAERLGLVQVGDSVALGKWVDEVLAASPSEVSRYRGGEARLIGFFVGQAMKATGGRADPARVGELVRERTAA